MLSEIDHAVQHEPPTQAMDTDADAGDDAHLSSCGDRSENAAASSGQVQCLVCSSTFRRPEHLKRHLRSHTKEKPFECVQCGRHFSRTDTLHRHELSHHTSGTEGGKDRTHRITVKTFRACFSCATARVRCSGGMPCGRCESRNLECQYPTERRSKARPRNGARSLPGADTHESDPRSPLTSPKGRRKNSKSSQGEIAPYQLAQFSVNTLNDPQASPAPSADTFSNGTRGLTETGRDSGSRPADSQSYLRGPDPELSGTSLPIPAYPNFRPQYHEAAPNAMPRMFTDGANATLGPQLRNPQPNPQSADVDMTIDMVENPGMGLDFDPSIFDPSMLSTVNWLPNEYFVDPASDQGQSSGGPSQFSQPFPDTYTNRMSWHPPVIHATSMNISAPENFPQTPSGNISMGTDMGSPRRHSHVRSEASPLSGSVDSTKHSADYYVDGGGARLPKYRKKQTLWSTSSVEMASTNGSHHQAKSRQFDFPSTNGIAVVEEIPGEVNYSVKGIDPATYNEIYRNFLLLCRNENPFFETFKSDNFPTAEDCNRYIVCYFDTFHTVYPVLHLPSFNPNNCGWLLALAVIAIGCHGVIHSAADQLQGAFHEMIHRALHIEKRKDLSGPETLELIQVLLFNCIGLLHNGSERAKASALSTFKDLVTLMNREKLLTAKRPGEAAYDTSYEAMWRDWIQSEIRRRTGYCIWLLDCTLAYYSEDRSLLSLDEGQAPLPAHEKLWQAESAEAWKQLWEHPKTESRSPSHQPDTSHSTLCPMNESLYDAVHILYIEKRLVSGIGEFSHILLIHALYHRMWEVSEYFRRPLSFWNPTARKQSRDVAIPAGSVWLPGIPSYSKWRNSACDCLDILHWTANSTIAKAAGLEHPTVLHLHMARLILLAPFREIRSLANYLASSKMQWSKRLHAVEWQYIWRWVRHDQYKARLSIIHAGVTLWHVRRYSSSAFHEPMAVYLAVLTLWAYGSCHNHASQDLNPEPQSAGIDRLQEPSFIHLDRPCDDELVQLFVREGQSMRGNITGVGDICAPDGPERVLRIGCETLSNLASWGNSERFIVTLGRLADLMSRNSDGEQLRRERVDTD